MGRSEVARRRTRTVAVMALGVLLAGAGCSNPAPPQGSPQSGDTAPPTGTKGLERFYSQRPSWQACGETADGDGKAQCAWVEVPVDYDKPDAGTIKLRMLKVPAKGKSSGSIQVNPGGPGGSAAEYARAGGLIVSPSIRRAYDIVGVDPRGVGQSNPIDCVAPQQVDAMMALDPTPDDASEMEASKKAAEDFGKACEQKYPQLLPKLSTIDAAKDMDVVRAVLGDKKLTYLGKSYGTFLGATYAGLFPQRVGSMVLDGAIAPELSNDELNLGQAKGFETATRAYVQSCVQEDDCPLGKSVDEGMQTIRDLLQRIDEKPLPVSDDARAKVLTEGWASTGMALALYDQASWEQLTDALRSAEEGDGTPLMALGREYADRDESGRYHGNIMQVISAVNCLDRPAQPMSDAERKVAINKYEEVAPTWGESMAMATVSCEEWPVRSTTKPEKIAAAGSGPIVVVGTTRDPATPYEWAQKLAAELQNGHLITFNGDGHTAYQRSNNCVDNAVDAYLLKGTVPKEGLQC